MTSIRSLSTAASISIPAPQYEFSFVGTSNPQITGYQVSLGDSSTYRLVVTLPRGTIPSLRMELKWPSSVGLLAVTEAVLSPLPSNIAASNIDIQKTDTNNDSYDDTVSISFTYLVNKPLADPNENTTLEFAFTALTIESDINTAGTQLVVNSALNYYNGTSTIVLDPQSVTLTLVRPQVQWTVVPNATSGQSGDVVSYAITVQHLPTSSAAAFNLDIVAKLGYFGLQLDSLTSNNNNIVLSPTPASSEPGWTRIAHLYVLPLDSTLVIQFNTVIDIAVLSASSIGAQFNATAVSSSSGGVRSALREQTLLTVEPLPASTLDIVNPVTGNVAIGDSVSAQFTFSIPKGTTSLPKVVIKMPYLSGLLSLTNATMAPLPANMQASGLVIALTDTDNDGYNDTYTVSLSSLVNNFVSVQGASNILVFSVQAYVVPTSRNLEIFALPVTSTFSYNNGTTDISDPRSISFQIVEPDLLLDVEWSSAVGQAGDVLVGSLSLQHAQFSTSPGYNVIVAAKFAPYFNLNTSSITSTDESAVIAPLGANGWSGIANVQSLSLGSSVVFRFSAVLSEEVRSASVLNNLFLVNYSSALVNGYDTYLYYSISFFFSSYSFDL